MEGKDKRSKKEAKFPQKCLFYHLTHAGIIKGEESRFHSLRWFGTCSYSSFGVSGAEDEFMIKKEKEIPSCFDCGSRLMPFWEFVKFELSFILEASWDPRRERNLQEILDILDGKDPPPNAKGYVLGLGAPAKRTKKLISGKYKDSTKFKVGSSE